MMTTTLTGRSSCGGELRDDDGPCAQPQDPGVLGLRPRGPVGLRIHRRHRRDQGEVGAAGPGPAPGQRERPYETARRVASAHLTRRLRPATARARGAALRCSPIFFTSMFIWYATTPTSAPWPVRTARWAPGPAAVRIR